LPFFLLNTYSYFDRGCARFTFRKKSQPDRLSVHSEPTTIFFFNFTEQPFRDFRSVRLD